MTKLTEQQAAVLAAFLDAFDLHITGAWATIEAAMRDEYGIDDPEAALADAREALSK